VSVLMKYVWRDYNDAAIAMMTAFSKQIATCLLEYTSFRRSKVNKHG